MRIYKNFEQAKNGTLIPVFQNGKTMESRYNPQRDAETLCASISEGYSFFLVIGIGSGLFIQKLSERFPDAKIIGLEIFNEDINFLKESETVKKLLNNKSVFLTGIESVEKTLIENYLPAKYGELKIIEQKVWISENSEYIEKINRILQKAIGIISADYSVQAHFGKLWNFNILNNAKLSEKYQNNISSKITNFISEDYLSKTAVIVAAGPTLDKTISILYQREKYFIISTDTAASSLKKHSITPDVIISIDGQNVSYNHFMKNQSSLYAFDLCANSSAAKHIIDEGGKVMFFCSGHPLSSAINASMNNSFPFLFSGAGTVTITAVDFAVQAGFENILIIGADFSYINGKAYAGGTYLDSLYNKASTLLSPAEKNFCKLLFRTELKFIDDRYTTDILEAYKLSLEKYLSNLNISFYKKDDIYFLNNKSHKDFSHKSQHTPCNFSLSAFFNKIKTSTAEESEILLLPYAAWLRNQEKYKNLPYNDLLKLAFESIVRYNI